MNLYVINFVHAAPKDLERGIKTYLLAENDEKVYEWIASMPKIKGESLCNSWKDKENDAEIFDIYDKDYNVIGTENFKEKMIRLKGEMNDDDADYSDSYYGITYLGWELIEENITIDLSHLIEIGIICNCH